MSNTPLTVDVTRADAILGAMPLVFGGVSGAGVMALDAWTLSIGVAALVCCVLVVDGLFVHPPSA